MTKQVSVIDIYRRYNFGIIEELIGPLANQH